MAVSLSTLPLPLAQVTPAVPLHTHEPSLSCAGKLSLTLAWALRLSRKGTLIIGDNVVRDGAVLDASSTDPSVVGIRRFNELLAAEPRVTVTAIQTVGSKGYDGFSIALVTGE